jgi:hypothetical protein
MSAVSMFWARNQRRALRWPSQAFAAPRLRVELSVDWRRVMSSSVQVGWSGMSILRPVSSAESLSEARKAEVLVETAMILPNCGCQCLLKILAVEVLTPRVSFALEESS